MEEGGIAEYKKVGWNPLLPSNMENRNPSREAIHRIRKDIKDVIKENIPGTPLIHKH
jgi:hypothetical protein